MEYVYIIITIILFVIISIIAVGIGIFSATNLTKPIMQLRNIMNNVESNNDLTIRSDNMSKDEVGQMSGAFNKMLEKFLYKRIY